MGADDQEPAEAELLADSGLANGDLAAIRQVMAQGWDIPAGLNRLLPQHLALMALNRRTDGEAGTFSAEDQRGAARLLVQMLAQKATLGGAGGGAGGGGKSARGGPTLNAQFNVGVPAGGAAGVERPAGSPRFVPYQRDVAEVFGMSEETIKDWREKGMPGEPGRAGHPGRYDLAEILRWRDANVGSSGRGIGGDASRQEGDRRRALASAEKLELEVRQRKGELMEVAIMLGKFNHANTHARALLEQGPHRLLGLLPAGATGEDKRRFLREAEKWIAGVVEAIHSELKRGAEGAVEHEDPKQGD